MTCIAAVAKNGIVTMGGDSAGVNPETGALGLGYPKVFRVGEYVAGVCGSSPIDLALRYDAPTTFDKVVNALALCPKCKHAWASHTNCYTTSDEKRFGCNQWKLGGTQQSNQDKLCHCMNRPDGTEGVGHPGYEIDGSDIEWED